MNYKLLYPEFKSKAVTFSYDDGVLQDRKIIEIFSKYNVKATFNLNYGKEREEKYRIDKNGTSVNCSYIDLDADYSLYDQFEIANHSFSHPHMEDEKYDVQKVEVSRNNEELKRVFSKDIYGFVYPYGTYNMDTLKVLRDLNVSYARTTKSTYSFYLPMNFYLWHPTIHHRDAKIYSCIADFKKTDIELALLYIWGHSYEFALDDNFSLLEDIILKIKEDEDVIFMTNYEIYCYVNSANMVYYRDGKFINPSSIDIYLKVGNKKLMIPKYGEYAYEEK